MILPVAKINFIERISQAKGRMQVESLTKNSLEASDFFGESLVEGAMIIQLLLS